MAEHGHGHEKAGSHGGGEKWKKKAMDILLAGVVGISFAYFTPALVSCLIGKWWGLHVPAYMAGMVGGAAGVTAGALTYAGNADGGHAKKGGGAHH